MLTNVFVGEKCMWHHNFITLTNVKCLLDSHASHSIDPRGLSNDEFLFVADHSVANSLRSQFDGSLDFIFGLLSFILLDLK